MQKGHQRTIKVLLYHTALRDLTLTLKITNTTATTTTSDNTSNINNNNDNNNHHHHQPCADTYSLRTM